MHRKPFSLTANISLGDWLPTHCMQSSLCCKWVWVRRTSWCGIKKTGPTSPRIHFLPYHPDDPECQLPSVLWGVCCQSGCVCVWRHGEADAVTLPTVHSTWSVKLQFNTLLVTNNGTLQPVIHYTSFHKHCITVWDRL